MLRKGIFHFSTFRNSLIAIPLNFIAGLIVVAFVFLSTQSIATRRIDRDTLAERTRLLEDLATIPGETLQSSVDARIDAERGSIRLYLLSGPEGVISANFTLQGELEPGELTTKVVRSSGIEIMARLSIHQLENSQTLILGRDLTDQVAFQYIIEETLLLAGALTAFFSVIVGVAVSKAVTTRLNSINMVVTEIIDENYERRIELKRPEDEFNALSKNINSMLDRIVELMTASKEVTSNIAHDLRTPLNRVRSQLELALLPTATRDEVEQSIVSALDEADVMSETFEALLTIARLDSGTPIKFELVDISALASDLVDYFMPLAEEKCLEMTLNNAASIPIMANRHLLFQAFSNAVDNSIRYTQTGGRIDITTEISRGRAIFTVADNGPGIPPEKYADVIKRFHRLDSSRGIPGTGLGLSVIDAISRHHKAALILSDNNHGLCLSIEFQHTAPSTS